MNLPLQLRVGVIVAGPARRWQRALFEQLAAMSGLQVTLLTGPTAEASNWLWQMVSNTSPELQIDAADTDVQPEQFLRNQTWDVLIDVGGTAPDDWANASRLGIWRIVDHAGQILAQAFPGIAGIAKKSSAEISLMVHRQSTSQSIHQPICQPTLRLLRRAHISAACGYLKSFAQQYQIAAQLVRQALIDELHGVDLSTPYRRVFADGPSIAQVLGYLGLGAIRAAGQRLHRMLFTESWMIGRLAEPVEHLLHVALPLKIQWLGRREHQRYLADPFCVPGRPEQIYCEVLDQHSDRGLIKQFTVNGDQLSAEVEVDFPVSGHLSYPYLFRENDVLYCVPEAGASRRCELYVQDPALGWRALATLLEDVAAADPTIFRWQHRYWLAYTDTDHSSSGNLCLAYADALSGPWLPHANNPVKIDQRSARSAGTPFLYNGKLVRPAQDCSQTYGGAVALNQIELCTPTAFSEHVIRLLLPSPADINPHGLHTIAHCNGQVLVDGKRHVINPVVLLRKSTRQLQHLLPIPFRRIK